MDMEQQIVEMLSDNFVKIIICNAKNKNEKIRKIEIRKVFINKELFFQAVEYIENKVYQKNLSFVEIKNYVYGFIKSYKNVNILLENGEKQGKILEDKILFKMNKSNIQRNVSFEHNKEKDYLLPDHKMCLPLVELGVMDTNGNVLKNKHDKFVQINNFLKVLDSVIDENIKGNCINIVDLCCGKSYLTFVVYYYLREIKKLSVNMVGVDLKTECIEKCNTINSKLGYTDIKFIEQDISNYKFDFTPDVVISLHACDIATDFVLKNAVLNNAKAILSVPCCHKELSRTIKNDKFDFMFKNGIVKERFSALLTDSLRACFLENNGYKTDIFEFVDFDNSPKNLMIKAVKTGNCKNYDLNAIAQEFNVNPTILKG